MADFTSSDWLTRDDEEELQQVFVDSGVEGGYKCLRDRCDKWKTIPLKLGIIGQFDAGKARFINTIRGLQDASEGAAPVGRGEWTRTNAEYAHPSNLMLKFCDLPVVGTPNVPKETFLNFIGGNTYDCFVIMTANIFTETDHWLAREITKLGKHFYFVRSNIDRDVANDRRDNLANHSEQQVIETIHSNLMVQVKEVVSRVFLIDNGCRKKYEFNDLELAIINNLSDHKRRAVILSLTPRTEIMVLMKAQELRSRCVHVALMVSTLKFMRSSSRFLLLDLITINEELSFYQKQLGLDAQSLTQQAKEMSIDANSLDALVRHNFSQWFGMDVIREWGNSEDFKRASSGYIRGKIEDYNTAVGIYDDPKSILFSMYVLRRMLDSMVMASLNLVKIG